MHNYYRSDRIRFVLYLLFSVLLVVIFSGKDILILTKTSWPHLYPAVNTSSLTFEEIYCYLPIFNHFSATNLLPAAPMVVPELDKFTFSPPITVIAQGILFKWVCFSNIDVYLLLSHSVFPLASFWLLFLIYRRYVAEEWATLFAFWGITFYNNFSSLSYLFNVIFKQGDVIQSASLTPLEITRVPFPNFSFFFFILCFYLSTLTYKLSSRQYVLLSILWSLNLYVYLYNFLAGIIFWFGYIMFTRYLNEKSMNVKFMAKALAPNLLIVFLFISPYLIFYLLSSDLDREIMQNMGMVYKEHGLIVNQWGIFLSYLLPLFLTTLIIWIYCGDYYELFYKFTPIFLMIFTELIILNLHLVVGEFFQPHLFSTRIGNFFPRYLYFIPVLYFLSNPLKQIFHSRINIVPKTIHSFFENYVVKYQIYLSALGILGIAFVIVASSVRHYEKHMNSTAPRMNEVYERFRALTAVADSGTLVSDDIPVNLLLPVLSKNTTLLVNSYNNYVTREEIIERLVLFAKIYGWDKARFLEFMMPDKEFEAFYSKNDFVVSDNVLKKGFGYWLVWHRRNLTSYELERYHDNILFKFEKMDTVKMLKKFDVKVIQTSTEIPGHLPAKLIEAKNGMHTYLIEN